MTGNFGFIHDKLDIKILILFILRRMHEPITFGVLTELAMCDGGISYFDFADCVAELVKTEHVRLKENKYSLTKKGSRNSEITENNLPFSVRTEAEKSTSAMRTMLNRNSMIKTSHEAGSNGEYVADLSLSDGIGDIVSIRLFATNERQAVAIERGFRKNAESIYSTLIDAILEEKGS
ncbi:MAG: DUF4364 family protein [Oscillospiraceae bacterium]|jgi:hypothetical protein|nr:DUF4364 family protein [Oscillospiraceae bacterium]